MAKKQIPWWIEFGLRYWQPLLALGAGGIALIVFLSTLNPRLSAQEKQNELQDAAIIELKKSNEIWQNIYVGQQAQQAPPQPWTFLKEEGEFQVFRDPDGVTQCCDGTTCHPKPSKGRCK